MCAIKKMYNAFSVILFVVGFLFLTASKALSQVSSDTIGEQKIMTLPEVIEAIGRNPSQEAYDEKIQSYEAYSKAAKAWEAPQAEAGLWMTPYNFSGSGSFMISAQQMIPNPARQRAGEKYMKGMGAVDQAMKETDRQNLIFHAKKIYYEWIVLKKKLQVLKENEGLMETMISSAEISYTYNQSMLPRIYKAKSRLYELRNQQIMYQSEIKQKNIFLDILMDIPKSTVFEIDTAYDVSDLPMVDTALISHRSDIRNIEESINLFNLKSNLERSKRLPEFGVRYAHMQTLGNMPNQFNLMGMVTIPFAPWAAKGYKANLKGISFETAALEKRKESILNEVTGRLYEIRIEYSNLLQRLENYEKNIIPALENNYKASLLAFEHTEEDLFMTIDAWMSLQMARVEYLELLKDSLVVRAEYERVLEK